VSIALMAMVPCLVIVVPQLRSATGPREALRTQPPPPLARAAAADPRHRAAWFEREWALSQRWSLSDDWVAWRAREVLGLSGAVPGHWDFAARSGLFASRAFLRACAVRSVAMPAGTGDDTVGVWPDALPRAYTVPHVRAVSDDGQAAVLVGDRGWDPAAVAFVIGGVSRDYESSAADSITWERDEPDRLALGVRPSASVFLVVADMDLPGWTARLDGRPVQVRRANLLFRGVEVPPGSHHLTFEYTPEGWLFARSAALSGWLTALALAVTGVLKRKRGEAAAAPAPA
jgi:hypothetical protein